MVHWLYPWMVRGVVRRDRHVAEIVVTVGHSFRTNACIGFQVKADALNIQRVDAKWPLVQTLRTWCIMSPRCPTLPNAVQSNLHRGSVLDRPFPESGVLSEARISLLNFHLTNTSKGHRHINSAIEIVISYSLQEFPHLDAIDLRTTSLATRLGRSFCGPAVSAIARFPVIPLINAVVTMGFALPYSSRPIPR